MKGVTLVHRTYHLSLYIFVIVIPKEDLAATSLLCTQRKNGTKTVPWGTVLENGAFFDKKGTMFGAPKQGSAYLEHGDVESKPDQMVSQGQCFGATYFFECVSLSSKLL